ncbi:MAG TPA: manganese catalase family protein [Bacilli bacterium]|nr:manganese catalase family protein [Bacilli bacterium]
MWKYEKKLAYPVNIRKKDLKMANYLSAQYGGPDSELGAALRYMNQRYSMPDDKGKALLTDIATEELAHVEMIATMITQLMKGATIEEIKKTGMGGMFTMHDSTLFPASPTGEPFTAAYTETTGDYIADIESDMAAEQRARATYEHLMDLTEDLDVLAPLAFLRQREVVHYQRFKELRNYYLDKKI